MPDIAGDSSTTSNVTVGSVVTSAIDVSNDHDWFRIELVAGQSITIRLNSSGATPLGDPYLRLRNSSGTLVAENDDSGDGLNSLLSFTATTAGTYYIDASAWLDPSTGQTSTGQYTLAVTQFTPPPVGTITQIANQLTHGYWDGASHHFNVTQGGSLTVNLIGLAADGQNLARLALRQWSDIIGVNFVEVSTGGHIMFDDNETGAFSTSVYANGITTSARVNVSPQWLIDSGNTVGSYGYQTYVHEIGHALGLGHAGNYNTSADYPGDARFLNDSWPMSIMSYFSVGENSYFSNLGFTPSYLGTPMVADIAAMGVLYGLSTTTRTGATSYGFNSNAGDIYNASLYPRLAYTVFDSGGIDTLDYSGFTQNQTINLTSGEFSNVGGRVGLVNIALGTIIENAIGGSGNDIIHGNNVANILTGNLGADTFSGGGGADIFRDTMAGHNGDVVLDFSLADSIVFTDASLGSFTFSLAGSTLTYTGGSMSIFGVRGQLSARAADGSGVALGVHLSVAQAAVVDARNDFNGDGRSDILWRNSGSGSVNTWLGQADGGFIGNTITSIAGADWTIVGAGDFNGDGRDDIVWRQAGSGTVTSWSGQNNGGFVGNSGYFAAGNDWAVTGTGDFDGDGYDDLLWRQEGSGIVTTWFGQADGNFRGNPAYHVAGTDWQIASTGDFNGDGRDDILWQQQGTGNVTNWLGQADGSFVGNTVRHAGGGPWTLIGSGDFNGDGRDDILWRHNDGTVTDWLGQADGNFVGNAGAALHAAGNDWSIVGIGDYNGDSRDDVLWRHTSGQVTDWLGQADGSFISSQAYHQITAPWQAQPDYWL